MWTKGTIKYSYIFLICVDWYNLTQRLTISMNRYGIEIQIVLNVFYFSFDKRIKGQYVLLRWKVY